MCGGLGDKAEMEIQYDHMQNFKKNKYLMLTLLKEITGGGSV